MILPGETIWALDISTKTGSAFGRPDETPQFETGVFGNTDHTHAYRFSLAIGWARDFVLANKPTYVFYEFALPANFKRGKTNLSAQILVNGCVGAVLGAIYRAGIETKIVKRIFPADMRDVRAHLLGPDRLGPNGRPLKSGVIKPLIRKRLFDQFGWETDNFDEADAGATWSYGRSKLDPELAMATTPLFRGAA